MRSLNILDALFLTLFLMSLSGYTFGIINFEVSLEIADNESKQPKERHTTMNAKTRIRKTFRSSKGELNLPSTLAAAVVSGLVLLGLASTVAIVVNIQVSETAGFELQAQKTNMTAALDRDAHHELMWQGNATHMEFQLKDPQLCRESVWDIKPAADGSQVLTNVVSAYANADCTGDLQTVVTLTLPVQDAAFSIQNCVGRALQVSDFRGTFIADDAVEAGGNPNVDAANQSPLATQFQINSDNFNASSKY